MTVTAVHHVGVLVDDFAQIRRAFSVLGLPVGQPESEPTLGLEILWIPIGDVKLEFLRPTEPNGRGARLLRAGAGGIHHVALTVDDVDATLSDLRRAGISGPDPVPRPGTHGTRIAFIDPAGDGRGYLEFTEPAKDLST